MAGGKEVTFKGTAVRLTVIFSTEKYKPEDSGIKSPKCWKGYSCQPGILSLMKISFKNEDVIKATLTTRTWEYLSPADLVLKEILKGVPQEEGNDPRS